MGIKIAIIGSGPAGYPAAFKAVSLGAEVTLIERNKIGGVCLNCGCIPSKSFLDAAHRFDIVRHIQQLCEEGTEAAAQAVVNAVSWTKIQQRQQQTTAKLAAGLLSMLRAKKINFINGEASFLSNKELSVQQLDGGVITVPFDYALIAGGTEAFIPESFLKYKEHLYDNSTIFNMPKLPKSLTIIGGGVIGCEFAALMNALGVTVNIVEMQPALLPTLDEGLSRLLSQSFLKRGVNIFTGKYAAELEIKEDGQKCVTLNDGIKLQSDEILIAIGRRVALDAMKLENIGVAWNLKGIQVNPLTMQVKDNIYAAGDVTGLYLLAHAATRQGEVAAANMCGTPMHYNNDLIPSAVFTWPEIASIGLTKKQAEEKGIEVKSHKAFLQASGRALAQGESEGFLEILSDKKDNRLLGAHMGGVNAAEIIHNITVALNAKMTVEQLQAVVFAHPTISELITDALKK